MKIIKISLPVIAVAAVLSVVADKGLTNHIAATADAGALPESTVLFNKMFTEKRTAKAKAKPTARLAVRDYSAR